jgi:hypothetical protein
METDLIVQVLLEAMDRISACQRAAEAGAGGGRTSLGMREGRGSGLCSATFLVLLPSGLRGLKIGALASGDIVTK